MFYIFDVSEIISYILYILAKMKGKGRRIHNRVVSWKLSGTCDVMWCDGCWLGAGCGTECLSPCHKLLLELHLESFNLQPQSWYDLLPETIHSHGLLTNIIPARIFKLSHFYKQATASVLYVQSVAVHCYLRGCLVGTKISREQLYLTGGYTDRTFPCNQQNNDDCLLFVDLP